MAVHCVAVGDLCWITCHLVSAAFSTTEVFLQNNDLKKNKTGNEEFL